MCEDLSLAQYSSKNINMTVSGYSATGFVTRYCSLLMLSPGAKTVQDRGPGPQLICP
jgi:hypothetical protein